MHTHSERESTREREGARAGYLSSLVVLWCFGIILHFKLYFESQCYERTHGQEVKTEGKVVFGAEMQDMEGKEKINK